MKLRHWSWVGACSTGSSHAKAGTLCQDFAACVEIPVSEGSALVAVVSDGAGSAQFAAIGSRTVARVFLSGVSKFLSQTKSTAAISEEIVRHWLDDIRDHIAAFADGMGAKRRDFAATLVAAIACPERLIVCHVGDGACVVRTGANAGWLVPSWPAHGEYASSTHFVTDDPEPILRVCVIEGQYKDIALFSDGLERLALDFGSSTAFPKFLDPMFAPLAELPPGRGRKLSAQLRTYLDSKTVIDRTDDDKTLVLATRAAAP